MKKLGDYARTKGVHYRTAWRWYHAGIIKGVQLPTGTILVDEEDETQSPKTTPSDSTTVSVYARVSSSENRNNLDAQADRIASYCAAKRWKISSVVKEIGSGLNDSRPKLLKLLADQESEIIVVEHKDRLTRFGFHYIETLLINQGRRVEVINASEGDREDLVQDFVDIITSFCARIYGQRRAKRKTEKLIAELRDGDGDEG